MPPPEVTAALAVEPVASADALAALAPEWAALWERSPLATPFQHPAWLLAWWRHLGGDGLWTLAVRSGGRLAGVIPLFVWSGGGARQVTPVGNGVSDHVDLLAAPGVELAVAEALLAHLADSRGRWDTADFRDLPADSPLLAAPLPDGVAAEVGDDAPCPVLPLPERIDELGDAVPRGFLKKARYARRRLERETEVTFEAADDASFAELFDALVGLHAARWAERGEPGVLGDPAVLAFHREAARGLLGHGLLRLYGMRIGGRIVAAHYGFAAKGTAFYYLGGFDPALEKHSPGTVMVAHAIEEAVREGAREFDFLRGAEDYKYAWGAADRPQRRLRLRRG